jgi:4-amino-4-deoxy-L-arabinose transferase-like glycosyltransferase
LNKTPNSYFYLIFALLLVAMFWNLGLTPIQADEPTRTVVAMEIMLSKNWFFTTINGEAYYNKPPLYNWLLIGLYKVTGSKSEFVARLPVVLSMLLMFALIYSWVKKYFTKEMAILSGLVFLTGSRIWFYDSMLGLIDMFFGSLIFLTFIIIYECQKHKQYWTLFITTYLIIGLCFLMKGMQALAFQGMTLLVWFIYKKEFKKLFGLAHIVGILTFAAVISLYLFAYNQFHPVEKLLTTLWSESSKRTIGGKPWYEDLLFILVFPVKIVLLDILPSGILLFALIKKRIRRVIFANDFLVFCLVCVGANILVYWVSPETRGRYLFPHYALLSIVCVVIFYELINRNWVQKVFVFSKYLQYVFICLLVIGILLAISIEIPKELLFIKLFQYKIQLLVLIPILLLLVYLNFKTTNLLWSVLLLLISLRLVFDAFVLPYRINNEPYNYYKNEVVRVSKKYQDRPLYKFRLAPLDHGTVHYMTKEQDRIIRQVNNRVRDEEAYYLMTKDVLLSNKFIAIDSFPQNWDNTMIYVAE